MPDPQQTLLSLLDNAPLRPVHYRLWLLSSGGTLLDGFSIFSLGVAMPLIVHEMQIRPSTVGLVGAAIVLGAIVGAAFGGPLADRFGRKDILQTNMLVVAIGGTISAVAPDGMVLFVGQFLVGMGIGADFPVGAAYVSEVMPKKPRARMMVATIACQSVGMLLAAAITMVLLKRFSDPSIWRGFLAIDGVVAVTFLLLRLRMPESVRWFMSKGRNADAARSLARILPDQKAMAESLATAAADACHHVALVPECQSPPGYRTLFEPAYRRRTILVTVPWFLMDVATYGVGLFTPFILGAMHLTGRSASPVVTDFSEIKGSAAIDLFLLIGFVVSLWAVPKFGHIRMQIIGFGGMAAGMALLFLGAMLPGGAPRHLPLVFAGFILFNFLMNAGPNATTFTLAPILFPTQLRASAAGLAAGIAKLGATLGVFGLPIVRAHLGLQAVLVMMTLVSLGGMLLTALVAHKIPDGIPLESHQQQ